MLDLYNNIYDRQTLKEHIYEVKFIDILKTQKIDATFAVRYILNKRYQLHDDDNITPQIVLLHQPHIKFFDLHKAIIDYDSDDDSINDFEVVSNYKKC